MSFYRQTFQVIKTTLLSLFNQSLKLGHVPVGWKRAKVQPIPKVHSHQNRLQNLRPISLLPTLSKILEATVTNRLTAWCLQTNAISSRKYGFVPSRGVELALINLTQYYMSSKTSDRRAGGVLIDLKSAFDLVPHNLLI